MKNNVKKSLSLALTLILLFTSMAVLPFSASAATKEKYVKGVYYEYTVKDGRATIVNASVSGNSAPKTITVPSKLGGKKVVAFEGMTMETKNTKTTTLVFPDSIEKIGAKDKDGFYKTIGCTNLATVKLGKNLKTMSYNPFLSSVKKFTVNSKNKYFSTANGILYNKKKTKLVAYPGAKSGKTYTVPKTVKTVGVLAFTYTQYLKTVNTNKVKSIKTDAFDASSVKTLNIGASLKSFTAAAVGYADFLSTVKVSKSNKYFAAGDGVLFNKKKTKLVYYPMKKKGTAYSVPKTVTAIGRNAFYYNKLKSVTLPSGVTAIGKYAFAFGRASVNLPSGLKAIGDGAFIFYQGKSLVFPSGLTSIGKEAFSTSSTLASVDFSKCGVTEIPAGCFEDCWALRTVTFSDKLTTVGASAFRGSGVLEVVLPANVTAVESGAFATDQLTSLTVEAENATLAADIVPDEVYDSVNGGTMKNPIVIKGFAGSSAEAFALAHGFTFELL